MLYTLRFSTALAAPASEVWRWISSFDGISREMAPFLHMSSPKGVTHLKSIDFRPGERMFRSWITLFGVIPFDYSDLTLLNFDEGSGFVEQSPMGTMRHWRHERKIAATDAGCVITDELQFEPRIAGRLTHKIVSLFFAHRHRRLRRFLGTRA